MSKEKATTDLTSRTIVLGLAGAVQRLGAATCVIGGSIAFEVSGPEGGRWRLDLTVPGGACREDDEAPASTTLHASPEALIAFFERPEEIPRLRAQNTLHVSGEVERLKKLGGMLSQTLSWYDRTARD